MRKNTFLVVLTLLIISYLTGSDKPRIEPNSRNFMNNLARWQPKKLYAYHSLINSRTHDWGAVKVGKDSADRWEAILENDQIYVRYGYKKPKYGEGMITDCRLKSNPEINIAGALLDAAAHRGILTNAAIVKDEKDEKTVRLEWIPVPASKEKHPGPASTEISIFPDRSYLKIVYNSFCFPHICDIGLMSGRNTDFECGSTFKIYGYDKKEFPQYEDCLFWEEDGCMGCTGEHAHPDGFAEDPGPLNYNGWFIMGTYLIDSGVGFGRTIPVRNIRVIKLLWNKGFELFPKGENVSCYLYFFNGGDDDVIKTGQQLVDNENDS